MSYQEEKDIFKMQQDFRNKQGLNSVYVQPTTGSAIDKANDWVDYQNTKSAARNSSTTTTSVSPSTSSSSTTSSSGTTSSSSTTSSSGTTSSVSTTSSNNSTAVAGTSTEISQTAADSSSSDTGDISSNTEATVGGEDSSNDYSYEVETAAEPSIETQAEDQPVAVAEEIPATPEQPSGQYVQEPEEGGQFWGTPYNDTLVGGAGADLFYGGKDQGSDTFLNVSSTDKVYLTDVTLNDLSDVKKEGDVITFTFKNGNTVNIQSSEAVSGAVVLGDSTWHFQHTPQA